MRYLKYRWCDTKLWILYPIISSAEVASYETVCKGKREIILLNLDMHTVCVIEIEHKTSHAAQEAIDVWTSAKLKNEGINCNPVVFGRKISVS